MSKQKERSQIINDLLTWLDQVLLHSEDDTRVKPFALVCKALNTMDVMVVHLFTEIFVKHVSLSNFEMCFYIWHVPTQCFIQFYSGVYGLWPSKRIHCNKNTYIYHWPSMRESGQILFCHGSFVNLHSAKWFYMFKNNIIRLLNFLSMSNIAHHPVSFICNTAGCIVAFTVKDYQSGDPDVR